MGRPVERRLLRLLQEVQAWPPASPRSAGVLSSHTPVTPCHKQPVTDRCLAACPERECFPLRSGAPRPSGRDGQDSERAGATSSSPPGAADDGRWNETSGFRTLLAFAAVGARSPCAVAVTGRTAGQRPARPYGSSRALPVGVIRLQTQPGSRSLGFLREAFPCRRPEPVPAGPDQSPSSISASAQPGGQQGDKVARHRRPSELNESQSGDERTRASNVPLSLPSLSMFSQQLAGLPEGSPGSDLLPSTSE